MEIMIIKKRIKKSSPFKKINEHEEEGIFNNISQIKLKVKSVQYVLIILQSKAKLTAALTYFALTASNNG